MNYQLARKIDHTLLKANATKADILRICEEAKAYHTASVCVNSCWAATAKEALAGSGICGIAVISAIFAQDDIRKATARLKQKTMAMLAS